MSDDEAEKAAREWVNENCSLYRRDDEVRFMELFIAGATLERNKILERIRTTIKDYQAKGLHEMVTALTVLECELEIK